MAINWDQLGNKLNQLLHNYAEFGKKYYDFFTAPPKDISLEFYDEEGNLVTKDIPNLAKLRDTLISSINSVLEKTIYVDADNGSDTTGDGTESAPFKTIQKAIDSVPSGAKGTILIRGDHIIKNVKIENKYIVINAYDDATIRPKLYVKTVGENEYYEYIGFSLYSGALLKLNIENTENLRFEFFVDSIGDEHPVSPSSGIIVINGEAVSASCHIQVKTTVDNRIPIRVGKKGVLFNIDAASISKPAYVSFSLSGYYEGTNRHIILDGDFANINEAPALLYVNYKGGFKDSTGSEVSIQDKIQGLIRDSQGIPRNIISNIIL